MSYHNQDMEGANETDSFILKNNTQELEESSGINVWKYMAFFSVVGIVVMGKL
jgi:hypothetical protein